MSFKKILLFGIVVVLLVAIPLTVYFLQQQQDTQTKAAPATIITFTPATTQTTPLTKKADETFDLSIRVDPGTNIVSSLFLDISYDKDKLEVLPGGLKLDPNVFPSNTIITEPQYTPGNVYVELSTAVDPTKQIQTPTTIGTLTFKAKAATTSPTQISFATRTKAYVGSTLANSDTESYNLEGGTGEILKNTEAAYVSITGSATATTITPSPTTTGTQTTTPSPTIVQAANVAPSCKALNIDRTPSGTAPFAITFTAIGSDSDNAITKATFNFGDGPVQEVSQAGGIGTKDVSIQISHTYNNPGNYTASVLLTDANGGVSNFANCTQVITVTQNGSTSGGGGTGGVGNSTPVSTQTPVVTIAPTGPSDTILGIGAFGIILSLAGALLYFIF